MQGMMIELDPYGDWVTDVYIAYLLNGTSGDGRGANFDKFCL